MIFFHIRVSVLLCRQHDLLPHPGQCWSFSLSTIFFHIRTSLQAFISCVVGHLPSGRGHADRLNLLFVFVGSRRSVIIMIFVVCHMPNHCCRRRRHYQHQHQHRHSLIQSVIHLCMHSFLLSFFHSFPFFLSFSFPVFVCLFVSFFRSVFFPSFPFSFFPSF